MIRALRRRHRWLAPLAFACAALGLGAAVAVRPAAPREAAPAPPRFEPGVRHVTLVSPALSVVRAAAQEGPRDTARLEVVPHTDLASPDLLAYAASSTGPEGADLPPGATLLGAVSPLHRTPLDVPRGTTTLVLYSLAHRARLATVDVAALVEVPVAGAADGEAR